MIEGQKPEDTFKRAINELSDLTTPQTGDSDLLKAGREALGEIADDMMPHLNSAFECIARLGDPSFVPPEDPGEFDVNRHISMEDYKLTRRRFKEYEFARSVLDSWNENPWFRRDSLEFDK